MIDLDTIVCDDSIELVKEFPNEYVHAIISDIPYGICYADWDVLHHNTNSALGGSSAAQSNSGALFKHRGKPLNGWSSTDKKIPVEYQEWCSSWATEWLRILKPGASCFVFAGRRFAHRCVVALEDAGFTFKDMLAWEKTFAPHRAQRLSEIYKRRGDDKQAEYWRGWRVANLRPLFEPILWFQKPYKTGGTLADNVLEYGVGAWNEDALSTFCAHGSLNANIISVKSDKNDHGLHETQKPLKLMECLVSLVTQEGAIVLDPFAGSGTTCLAAKNLHRHYIGIEQNKDFVAVAQTRLLESAQQITLNTLQGCER